MFTNDALESELGISIDRGHAEVHPIRPEEHLVMPCMIGFPEQKGHPEYRAPLASRGEASPLSRLECLNVMIDLAVKPAHLFEAIAHSLTVLAGKHQPIQKMLPHADQQGRV